MEKRGGLERKEESLTRSRGENHRRRSQEFGELAEAAVDGPEGGTLREGSPELRGKTRDVGLPCAWQDGTW